MSGQIGAASSTTLAARSPSACRYAPAAQYDRTATLAVAPRCRGQALPECSMLKLALICLAVAVVAGILGFVVHVAAAIAKLDASEVTA